MPVKMLGYPYLTIIGAVLLLSLMITTWFTGFKIMLQFGIPWLLFLTVVYPIFKKKTYLKDQNEEINENIN